MMLVSWNILAQSTVPGELQEALAWEKRLPAILEYLLLLDADFICLQEVELNTFEDDFKDLITVYKFARHAVCMKGKHKRTNTFGNVTMWKKGTADIITHTSRNLHVDLHIADGQDICIYNVHFPAKPGFEGYIEKRRHLMSCVGKWDTANVIVAGDFNDGLCFKTEDGKLTGLHTDFTCLGFIIAEDEMKKQTCKSFRGNIYNVDHVLSRAGITTSYIPQLLDVNLLPCPKLPSDHLPILYKIVFAEVKG